jgi:hypothetical protein
MHLPRSPGVVMREHGIWFSEVVLGKWLLAPASELLGRAQASPHNRLSVLVVLYGVGSGKIRM